MWTPGEYTYNEFNTFHMRVSLDIQDGLRKSNPRLEMEGAVYAILCLLDSKLEALPPDAVLLDEAEQDNLLSSAFVECFGREIVFGFVRTGRTIVIAVRSEDPSEGDEEEFLRNLSRDAMSLHYVIEDNIGDAVGISISPAFDSFAYCEQVACEALTAADFVRFAGMPALVITPQYCDNVKQIIGDRNPDHRISNYERPIISAMLNGNLAHAERIVNDLLTAHLMDPLYVFPSVRSAILNTMRTCQSLCYMDPRAFANNTPRLPLLQEAMKVCPTADKMRTLIHEYFELLASYMRQNREEEMRNERMNKIIKYIEEHIFDPLLGAPMVCDEFDMSTTYFSRIFKADMGVNFSVFLQTLRITKAKNLLLETDMSLNEIAQNVGYISSKNLFRLFKRYEGMSPSAYRQMAGKSNVPDEGEE